MLSEDRHLSDQELLLAADGELPTDSAAQVHAHLAACWSCRARTAESKGQLLISRELTAGLSIPHCHPLPAHVRS
jgi:anti-sigma factor RsiW